jgi:3'-phosphoadenosine 5'-phosphosulfate (PAPS) 3'-phosphatase
VQVIRSVQRSREAHGDESLGATQKDAEDPKSALTVADTAAQVAVMATLRGAWPRLCIIGEEDEEGEGEQPGPIHTAAPVAGAWPGPRSKRRWERLRGSTVGRNPAHRNGSVALGEGYVLSPAPMEHDGGVSSHSGHP